MPALLLYLKHIAVKRLRCVIEDLAVDRFQSKVSTIIQRTAWLFDQDLRYVHRRSFSMEYVALEGIILSQENKAGMGEHNSSLLMKNSPMEGRGERIDTILQLQQRLQQPPQLSPKTDQRWRDKPEEIERRKGIKG